MNADWHRRHPMPKNPTLAERVSWHRAHARHCACRPVPDSLRVHLKATSGKRRGRRPGAS